ncbi:hypothetical protein JCM12296A_55910 [Desulfosarcina cetonica]|uniref:hypothetical protein n=1 Tax=Desulfosarcina cetonica TaxID=90730 RepID=UPI0006D2367A|nr:hypothetical protein [Desulfosarcina cetonica]
METENEREEGLKQVKAFVTTPEHFGIPSKIFFAIIFVAVGIGALVSFWMIIAYLLVLGVPAYRIHKKDPSALAVLKKAVCCRYSYWQAGTSTPRGFIIIKEEDQ